jgi:2-haloalkanoic acid dehalogenase type II
MDTLYDIVTFDCYGTLIDWNAGLGNALVIAAGGSDAHGDRDALLAAYHEFEPMVEAEPHRSYRAVLTETTIRAARSLGRSVASDVAGGVADSVPNWLPFPDTNPALLRLSAAGYQLGILSNVDEDLLAGTRQQLSTPFQLVVTAEQAGSYKPALGHFEMARRAVGGARWLHVAQSYFHDVAPAGELGIPVAWINRLGERPAGDAIPDREFRDLTELADWLTGPAAG